MILERDLDLGRDFERDLERDLELGEPPPFISIPNCPFFVIYPAFTNLLFFFANADPFLLTILPFLSQIHSLCLFYAS